MGTASIAGSVPPAPSGGASAPASPVAPPTWSAQSNGPDKASDFASDLAHLMSLLTQGRCEMADAELPSRGDSPAPESAAATTDTVSCLWAELGLALSSREPMTPPEATGPSAGQSGSTDVPVAGAAGGAKTPALSVVARSPGTDETAVSADALARASSDDSSTSASAPNLASLAAFAPAESARHGASAVAVPQAVVDLRQPQAPQQIAESVAWHVGKGVSEVQIRLNPEDLGPLDIKLKMDGDKVSVRFDTADASVRDVVQTSLPTLSSLLAARGLQLDQAQVFSQNRGHGTPQHPPHSPSTSPSPGAENNDEMSLSAIARPVLRRGLLDDYA